MKMRDRLIELLKSKSCRNNKCPDVKCCDCEHLAIFDDDAERIVDAIIADGWMRPPCKVGDTVYKIFTKYTPFVGEYVVEDYGIPTRDVLGHYLIIPFDEIGKTVFLGKEEAEKALKGDDGK